MKQFLITTTPATALMVPSLVADKNADVGVAAYRNGDYALALRELLPLAEDGNMRAQFKLGLMYDLGQGVLQNDVEAVRWYRLAAEQGDAKAQFKLGFMYADGHGVPQDDAEAVRWYSLAVGQGNIHAATLRDELATCMTPNDIIEAHERAFA